MNTRWVGMLGLAVAAGLPTGAGAQNVSTVREIVRVVKTAKAGTPQLADAKVGTQLATGDRLRTGGRSAAGVRFPDKSLLRLGELTEVELTNAQSRQARVLRGQVFANYKSPGAISGGQAVAAVRGTKVHYIVDEKSKNDQVICYQGRVFVSSSENPIFAGTTSNVAPTTLTDPNLVDHPVDWRGGEVRFTAGPYDGQSRGITLFDRVTGTVTWAPALGPALPGVSGPSDYLLIKNKQRDVVELGPNTATIIRPGQDPTVPSRVPGEEFARLDRFPFFNQMFDGMNVLVWPNTIEYQQEQAEEWAGRDAEQRVTGAFIGGDECDCGGHPLSLRSHRHRHRLVGASKRGSVAALGRESVGALERGSVGAWWSAPISSAALALGGSGESRRPPTPEEISMPALVRPPYEVDAGHDGQFRFEPFAFATDETEAAGTRLRFQGVTGDVYAEVGYRFLHVGGDDDEDDLNEHDVSEGFVHLRGRSGNLIAGRQHLFLGPAQNNDIGTLLGLESVDAIVLQTPLNRRFRQQFGYLFDTKALDNGGHAGGYARGLAHFGRGNIGYSVIASTDDDARVGWSVDAVQSLIPNVLDIYGEGGKGVRGRDLRMAGLYIPALYHAAKLDAFIEYAFREDFDERYTLRLRREMGNGLLLIAFVDRIAGAGWDGGGGFLWSLKFK
jgi:FecR-like protein